MGPGRKVGNGLASRVSRSDNRRRPVREYTRTQTLVANLPYGAMVVTGAVLVARAFDFSTWALVGAAGYLAYGITGTLWIMVFICPHCAFYDTRGCPCGYGTLSARFVRTGEQECFAEKFKRHIPVIVPLWLIPVVCGAWGLSRGYSGVLVGLVAAFVVNSYVLLLLVSRRHGCSECPQKEGCPWMTRGSNPS
jgi:hypothetical protein